MLVRAFRLTDKFSNALLRALIWGFDTLLRYAYDFRVTLINSLATIWFFLSQTLRFGRSTYTSNVERRREMMARRSEELATRTVVREDPLKTQNRALSLFTVVLLALLIGLVIWTTSSPQSTRPTLPPVAIGTLPIEPTRPSPTPTVTLTATPTQIPDPLRVGGSIVYSMRVAGRDNLFVRSIGLANPIRLTNTPTDDRDPVWSPDGKQIAFASHRDGQWNLHILDVVTGAVAKLTSVPGYHAAPTWSPDGKYLAFESYQENNLDIWIIRSDGQELRRVTSNPAPDFAPAWSPQGREIAYVSLRDGSPQIYVISLDKPDEYAAKRITNQSGVDVDYPAWSPDGTSIAYSGVKDGIDLVYLKSMSDLNADPAVVGRGHEPAWAPNGTSVLFALDSGKTTTFISGLTSGAGGPALAFSLPARANHPNWTSASLPDSLLASGGLPANDKPLYTENIAATPPNPPYYQLRVLPNVRPADSRLSERVDDSFNALRQAVLNQVGYDFLGTLQDAWWSGDRPPDRGQSRQSWHYAGRAFAFVQNLVFSNPPTAAPVEIVREDSTTGTFWRVYIRVDDSLQGGKAGEPLKHIPWDVASRTDTTDPTALEQGGRLKQGVPTGYYIDFTQLAEDYGWERVPADRNWRSLFSGMLYWEFDKSDSLAWNDAMLELYSQQEIDSFLYGPTAIPSRTPIGGDTPGPTRTPTPQPPA